MGFILRKTNEKHFSPLKFLPSTEIKTLGSFSKKKKNWRNKFLKSTVLNHASNTQKSKTQTCKSCFFLKEHEDSISCFAQKLLSSLYCGISCFFSHIDCAKVVKLLEREWEWFVFLKVQYANNRRNQINTRSWWARW